jgi:hypothetical protein
METTEVITLEETATCRLMPAGSLFKKQKTT